MNYMSEDFQSKFPELKLKVRDLKKMPLLFSERNGYIKLINISFVQEHCLSRSRVKKILNKFKEEHFEEDSDHPSMTIHKSDFDAMVKELGLSEEKDETEN